MNRASLRLCLVALLALGPACVVRAAHPYPPAPPPPPYPVQVAPFPDVLTPSGEWIIVPELGRVWRPYPSVVGPGFVPYVTGGWWAYTDHGWMFASRWDWGWAVYEYGNWVELPNLGWVWVPGDVWAPAWVEWRIGGGFIGWRPIPPPYVRIAVAPPPWSFVETRVFPSHRWVERHVLTGEHYHRASGVASSWIPPPPGRAVSPGPPRDVVEREASVHLRPVEVEPPPRGRVEPPRGQGWPPPDEGVMPPPSGGPAPREPERVPPGWPRGREQGEAPPATTPGAPRPPTGGVPPGHREPEVRPAPPAPGQGIPPSGKAPGGPPPPPPGQVTPPGKAPGGPPPPPPEKAAPPGQAPDRSPPPPPEKAAPPAQAPGHPATPPGQSAPPAPPPRQKSTDERERERREVRPGKSHLTHLSAPPWSQRPSQPS
jgi:hypothetical protein